MCTSVYVASAIAKTSWLPTAWMSMKVGIAGFVVPFMFCFAPGLLLQLPPLELFVDILSATIGVLILAMGIIGYLRKKANLFERVLLISGGVMLIEPSVLGNIVGLVLGIGIYSKQRFFGIKARETSVAP